MSVLDDTGVALQVDAQLHALHALGRALDDRITAAERELAELRRERARLHAATACAFPRRSEPER